MTAAQTTEGFVPVVVPCHGGVDSVQRDISWTAGYALVAARALAFYGGIPTGNDLVSNLHKWVSFELANKTGAIPTSSSYGDLASPRGLHQDQLAAGQVAAAANFVLVVEALRDIATLSGDTVGANSLQQLLTEQQLAFHKAFWSDAQGCYFNGNNKTIQTVNAAAIAALASAPSLAPYLERAGTALIHNLAGNDYALTVGAVGVRWLLKALSVQGDEGHDAAIRTVMRTDFPGWGYWLANNASTCWESWTTELQPQDDHYHGSRNHGWLCGAVGEWFYSELAGVSPTILDAGFRIAHVAPHISQTLGPSAVNVTLRTARGLLRVAWARQPDGKGLHFTLSLPMTQKAILELPLMTLSQTNVIIQESSQTIWDGVHLRPTSGLSNVTFHQTGTNRAILRAGLESGDYYFQVVPQASF